MRVNQWEMQSWSAHCMVGGFRGEGVMTATWGNASWAAARRPGTMQWALQLCRTGLAACSPPGCPAALVAPGPAFGCCWGLYLVAGGLFLSCRPRLAAGFGAMGPPLHQFRGLRAESGNRDLGKRRVPAARGPETGAMAALTRHDRRNRRQDCAPGLWGLTFPSCCLTPACSAAMGV